MRRQRQSLVPASAAGESYEAKQEVSRGLVGLKRP